MPLPSSTVIRALRTAAWVILCLGWLIPMGLATLADRGVPGSGSPFRWVAGTWLVLAMLYAVVIAVRVRRGLVR